MVQRSWIGDRIDWVKAATRAGNWETSEPPGVYYVLNGLSVDDMVRVLRALTPAERTKITDNLEEHGGRSDRPRIHLALTNASTPTVDPEFRQLTENLHWAIRSENFTAPPDGAFHILAGASPGKLAGLVASLNRDALDALIDRREEAQSVRGASAVMAAIERKRGTSSPNKAEQGLIDLIEGGDWQAFFTEFNGMKEFDQLRFLRGSPGTISGIRDNLRLANGIGDPLRIGYLLERASTSAGRSLYVDAMVETFLWQPKYKVKDPRDLSRIIRFGHLMDVEVDINSISDEQMSEVEADRQFREARPGPGGFLWPAVWNRSTLPVLWKAKLSVRQQQETILFDEVLSNGIFVVQYLLDVVYPVAHTSAIRSLGMLRAATLNPRWMKGAQVVRGTAPMRPPYASSLGELAEGPILRRDYPNARSAPPKFKAYDGVEGGTTTETLTTEGTKANPRTVVTQTVKGGRWISIKSVLSAKDATVANIRKMVKAALNDMYNDAHNPSLRRPALDPDPIHPNTFYRMVKESPERVTLHIELPVKVTPELEAAARAAVKESTVPAELPPFDLVIKGVGQ